MAINLIEKQRENKLIKHSSNIPKEGALPSSHLIKLRITADGSISSNCDAKSNRLQKSKASKSPYLSGDCVQLLSRVQEKNFYTQQKRDEGVISSFPLAATIYRANSDEFKSSKKAMKKVKKSVLTLPNARTAVPQTCTVSDTNDSKYFETYDNQKQRTKKRFQVHNRKSRMRNKEDYDFYDRDARYCSQMNIDLDCSSTELMNQFTGDCNRKRRNTVKIGKEPRNEQEFTTHDVWAVLRNINRFQFRPSPPISEDSIKTLKKKKNRNIRKKNRRDTRVIETCRTEEFAYISSYDVDSKSPISFSQSSSFDRITVIEKQDEFNKICQHFEKKNAYSKNVKSSNRQALSINQNKKNMKSNCHATVQRELEEMVDTQMQNPQAIHDIPSCEHQFKISNNEYPVTLVTLNQDDKMPKFTKYRNKINITNSSKHNAVTFQPRISNGTLHSGSSKAAIVISTNLKKEFNGNTPKVSPNETHKQVNGITKVTVCTGPSIAVPTRNNDNQNKRSPRENKLINLMPKFTQTEIKRRLANMRFPIIILGKDQVCTTALKITEHDPPHLQGLDQRIWPYMKEWYVQSSVKDCGPVDKNFDSSISKHKSQYIDRKNNARKLNIGARKAVTPNIKYNSTNDTSNNKKKQNKRSGLIHDIDKNMAQQPKRTKTLNQFKDKMLKLLYKKSSKNILQQCKLNDPVDNYVQVNVQPAKFSKKTDVSTETFIKYDVISEGITRNADVHRNEAKTMPIMTKQPWAKAKWASDFIETVIKKIRSGVYYNMEINKHTLKARKSDYKDIPIQTILTGQNVYEILKEVEPEHTVTEDSKTTCTELLAYPANDYLDALPGFDDCLPALEIKTLNMKEVAVKHCPTNVMVQFDVGVPSDREPQNKIRESSSLVPLAVTESHTKIFKCKTTIINAMLPAEICSILPQIFRSILDTNLPLPSIAPLKNNCLLYTISETSNSASQDLFKPIREGSTYNVGSELLGILNGVFAVCAIPLKLNSKSPKLHYDNFSTATLLLRNLGEYQQFTCKISFLSIYSTQATMDRRNIAPAKPCTALALYQRFSLCDILRGCYDTTLPTHTSNSELSMRWNVSFCKIPIDLIISKNTVSVNVTNINNGFDEKRSIIINKDNFFSIYNGFKTLNIFKPKTQKALEVDKSFLIETDKKFTSTIHIKTKKKKYAKLHRKCKSTSNISAERLRASLSKITNLDDFFQVLGLSKILCCIFDGLSGKRILSAITEMKSWITEISQRQAMLVLLLSNKKDTPNLIRFRPILLQAIAVNRITRASELDMEIEVIERENFNKFSKFEGIPYTSESVENHDNLLEELYWIAKTTASDYQKPFNEASEKLLKSLLEKRKKLNPSYLRVMARYVGLGLLKSPNKK